MQEVIDRDAINRRLVDLSAFWQDRIATWRTKGAASGSEKRHAQQFWSDLMRCFGITPEHIDVFERNADRASTGGGRFIDFFWSGVVIGEAKSLGQDLDVAYNQAMDYLNGGSVSTHEWPRFIMATDFENIRLDRLGDESWTVRFTIGELPDYLDKLLFFAGMETLTKREQENASIEAAKIMANLFNSLAGEDADEDVGDDAPTLPLRQRRYLRRYRPSRLLSAPEFKDVLLDASRFRWTTISPEILGSMFQLVKKKEARRGDGEHYTSETNILKTLEPLFLDDYRTRADRLIANMSTTVPDLRKLQQEIASNIYLDPAFMRNARVSRNTQRSLHRQVRRRRLSRGNMARASLGSLLSGFSELRQPKRLERIPPRERPRIDFPKVYKRRPCVATV